jgi:hypothetical protein
MNKEQYNLEQKLQAIWRKGDRDEMSVKHIGHGIAALIAYGDWKLAEDYRYPKYFEYSDMGSDMYDYLDKWLEPKWSKVEVLLDTWGVEKFLENLSATSFGFYTESYLEASYLPYAQAMSELQVS